MKPEMNQNIVKVAMQLDRHGKLRNFNPNLNETLIGRFRYATSVESGRQNMEESGSDGTAWFNPGENIARGNIISVDGETFKIKKIIYARTFENNIEFLKCPVERFNFIS